MKKMLLNIIYLFIITFIAVSVFAQDTGEVLGKTLPGYILLHYREGNFTGSGLKEYVAFYKDEKEDEMVKKEPDWGRSIEKVIVTILKGDAVIQLFDLKATSFLPQNDKLLNSIITNYKVGLTEWDNFCYVKDLNKDGLDDIIFFYLTGMGTSLQIYQYNIQTKDIEKVLDGPPNHLLRKIEVREDKNQNIIRLYDEYWISGPGTRNSKSKLNWYDYTWNGKEGKYEIIEKGEVKELKK